PWLSKRLCIDGLRRRATRCRRYFARAQSPIPLVELARKRLVLIGSDEIHPVGDRGPPARNHALHRSEIVVFIPTPVLRRVEAVQRVEADPVTLPVRVINQAAQAAIVRFRPGAGPRLAPLLDGPPAVVPPAAIVRGACVSSWEGRAVASQCASWAGPTPGGGAPVCAEPKRRKRPPIGTSSKNTFAW